MMIKPGVELLSESLGEGAVVVRHNHYQLRLRIWLRRGEPVRWEKSFGEDRIEDDGITLITDVLACGSSPACSMEYRGCASVERARCGSRRIWHMGSRA